MKEVCINPLGPTETLNKYVTFPEENRTIYNEEGSIHIVPTKVAIEKYWEFRMDEAKMTGRQTKRCVYVYA